MHGRKLPTWQSTAALMTDMLTSCNVSFGKPVPNPRTSRSMAVVTIGGLKNSKVN